MAGIEIELEENDTPTRYDGGYVSISEKIINGDRVKKNKLK